MNKAQTYPQGVPSLVGEKDVKTIVGGVNYNRRVKCAMRCWATLPGNGEVFGNPYYGEIESQRWERTVGHQIQPPHFTDIGKGPEMWASLWSHRITGKGETRN